MTLQAVPIPPIPCWPWDQRVDFESDGHPIGTQCDHCLRDIALPRQFEGRSGRCVYCCFATGILPLEEWTPDDLRTFVEVARDCARSGLRSSTSNGQGPPAAERG